MGMEDWADSLLAAVVRAMYSLKVSLEVAAGAFFEMEGVGKVEM